MLLILMFVNDEFYYIQALELIQPKNLYVLIPCTLIV